MPFPLPKAIKCLCMVYRTKDKEGGPAQLSPACLSNICSCCSLLCSDASALLNYLQFWNVLGSLPETTFLWLPFQHLPSIFSGDQPLWVSSPWLCSPTSQAELRTCHLVLRILVYTSLVTPISLWWLLLYCLVFPTEYKQPEGKGCIIYLYNPGAKLSAWPTEGLRLNVQWRFVSSHNLITEAFWFFIFLPQILCFSRFHIIFFHSVH